MHPLVSVTIVTYNSERYIGACLDSVFAQDYRPLEIIVVDNASRDETAKILERCSRQAQSQAPLLLWNQGNPGFSAGQNQAIRAAKGKWVLTLNPDVVLEPDFISQLVAGAQSDGSVGTVCGRLAAMPPASEAARGATGVTRGAMETPASRGQSPALVWTLLDSTGIYFTPTLRHFDRGCGRPDNGEYNVPEYVFGATAAAALYRREMIEDISTLCGAERGGEFFDEDFFAYREDADVAWRAQLLGWKCLYLPKARGRHVRRAHPGNRRALPPLINMHSVKNRFLMRLKNITPGLYLRHLAAITLRDLCVVGYCLFLERTSLAAFGLLRNSWKRALAKRRWIQQRRRVPDREIARWFRYRPVAEPVPAAASLPERTGLEACPTSGNILP